MATKAETKGEHWSVAATSGRVPLSSESPFDMPFVPGEIIADKYEVIELIGVGGVGFVVAANHIELGEKVALKFLRPEMLIREDIVARFAQEALAAVRIKNEHVARVFDVGTLPNGNPFIVMEFLEGRDLYEIVQQDGPQPVKTAIDYVLQACEALADAHSRGIVHRDVKPENLFLIQRAEGIDLIKVLDFGISKLALTGSAIRSKVPLVRTMLPMGSPVYMSPEQIRASKDIDLRTDIWSMGCVLHELLTGSPAFDAPSLTQLSATILEEHPPKISDVRAVVPRELDAIVSKCLEKSPNKRYQNMAELALALYPYGPRRSRLSAERCCKLLKVEGSGHSEFELPSARPPGWETLPSGAYPAIRDPSRTTATSGVPSEDRETLIVGVKPKRKGLLLGLGGALLVAAVAVAAVLMQSKGSGEKADTKQATATLAADQKAPGLAPKNADEAHAPARVSASNAEQKAAPNDSADSSRATGASARGAARAPIPVQKVRRRITTGRPDTGSSEPDPGF